MEGWRSWGGDGDGLVRAHVDDETLLISCARKSALKALCLGRWL